MRRFMHIEAGRVDRGEFFTLHVEISRRMRLLDLGIERIGCSADIQCVRHFWEGVRRTLGAGSQDSGPLSIWALACLSPCPAAGLARCGKLCDDVRVYRAML